MQSRAECRFLFDVIGRRERHPSLPKHRLLYFLASSRIQALANQHSISASLNHNGTLFGHPCMPAREAVESFKIHGKFFAVFYQSSTLVAFLQRLRIDASNLAACSAEDQRDAYIRPSGAAGYPLGRAA